MVCKIAGTLGRPFGYAHSLTRELRRRADDFVTIVFLPRESHGHNQRVAGSLLPVDSLDFEYQESNPCSWE
jgi:hypothetical protein